MGNLFEVTDSLFFCSSYEHGYWCYNISLRGESVDLLPSWCFPGIFCLSNVFYECFGRQSLLINRGIINLIPRMPV
jgi:hypothetical protein